VVMSEVAVGLRVLELPFGLAVLEVTGGNVRVT
jgi:hypothetical protein